MSFGLSIASPKSSEEVQSPACVQRMNFSYTCVRAELWQNGLSCCFFLIQSEDGVPVFFSRAVTQELEDLTFSPMELSLPAMV